MKAKLFLMSMIVACLAALGSHAQVRREDPSAASAQLQSVIAKAMESAVYEDGKIRSIKMKLPGDRERLLTFEHAEDGRSFTMIDAGLKVVVRLNEYGRISEVISPNGKRAVFEWLMMPTGYWVPSAINVDGKNLCSGSGFTDEDGSCREICEQAAAASAIAVGTCIAAGPTSAACWSATATAAYLTYRCYRCSNPQTEWPPEN